MPLDLARAVRLAYPDPNDDPYPTPGSLERAIRPGAWRYPHLDLLDRYLLNLVDGTLGTRGLMVYMQPRAGKSDRCSRAFPLWYLRRRRTHRLVLGTYGQDLGEKHSRWIRNTIESRPDLGLHLASDSKAVGDWELTTGGGLIARGVGGGVTGRGGQGVVIDDPVKNREEAESQTMRDKAWDWWTDDLSTRLTVVDDCVPWVLLMMTRWHEDDLGGRLEATEPEHWTVLRLPAIAETDDPLGRPPGGLLMPDRYGEAWIAEQRTRLGTYAFEALYQQRPSPAEGSLFRKANFRYWSPVDAAEGPLWKVGDRYVRPRECWRFVTVDLAASTKTSADWTVAAVWAVTVDGDLLLLDRERQRITEGDHWPMVRRLAERWGTEFVGVESRMFGTRLVWDAGYAGMPIRELKADADKITRAIPASVRTEQGRAWFPEGAAWLDEWEQELLAFPNGAHDDQVDVFAYAALELARGRADPAAAKPATPDERFHAHLQRRAKQMRRGQPRGEL